MTAAEQVCFECGSKCKPGEGKCITYNRVKRFFQQSNLDRPYWTFEKERLSAPACDVEAFTFLADIEKNIREWVQSGNNVIIYSSHYGNGKSTWARRLLRSYFQSALDLNTHRAGLYLSMFEFLDRQRDGMSSFEEEQFQELKHGLLTADLVVWDDLVINEIGEFAKASLNNIIDTRINRKLSNIYTANYKPMSDNFRTRLGARLWDRVVKMSYHICFEGEGMRGEKLNGHTANPFKSNK